MAKKSLTIDNPALQFISAAGDEKKNEDIKVSAAVPEQKKQEAKETKSKRLNLLLLPSVYRDIKKIATMRQTSTNELIGSILEDFILNHVEELEKYNKAFGEGEQ